FSRTLNCSQVIFEMSTVICACTDCAAKTISNVPTKTLSMIWSRLILNVALLTDGLTAVLLPSTHPVCYPFIEVGRTHNSLYPGKPHIVSDDVAHPRPRHPFW